MFHMKTIIVIFIYSNSKMIKIIFMDIKKSIDHKLKNIHL